MSAGAGSPPANPPGSTPEKTGWPKVLSLAVHEFRSPLTVVSGYVRMILKERAGPVLEQQRRLLEEAEKSCARLSTLLAELSELSNLEAGTAPFNRSRVELASVVNDAIERLPPLPDRTIAIDADNRSHAFVHGDAVRLASALSAILGALRRELVTSDQLGIRVDDDMAASRGTVRLTIAEAARMDEITTLRPADLSTFDEWRGGNGLGVLNARRIIEAHGGRIWSIAEDGKSVAVISLPTVE
jgi:signal transduction histidine kinase